MSLLSRSSDLARFRLAKIEPEPMVPLRVQSVGPGDWVPPTLQAVKAWGNIELPEVMIGRHEFGTFTAPV